MGKGIIEMAPDKVYGALRNPQLRYTYDNLLKVSKLLFHIYTYVHVNCNEPFLFSPWIL